MPNRSPRTPSYRVHKPSGQAVVTLRDAAAPGQRGVDFYLGPWGSQASKQRYDSLVARWLAGGRQLRRLRRRQSTDSSNESIPLGRLAALYLRTHVRSYYVKNGRPTSEQALIRSALLNAVRFYRHTPAASFGAPALKVVRDHMVATGLARNTINAYVARIRGMFRWAVTEGLVPSEVMASLAALDGLRAGRSPARETEPIRHVPEAYVQAVRPHVSRPVWAMIQLQGLTGMRPGEVTTMRGRALDTSGANWECRPSENKTQHHGYERVVWLGPKAQAIVRPFLKPDLDAYLFTPPGGEEQRGRRYSPASYRRAIRRACERANAQDLQNGGPGVPFWHPRQLRHNFATKIRREFGLEAARALLGHHGIPTTELYAELDQSRAATIMAEIG